MERIGVLGGTFNPVHNGHLHLARGFLSRSVCDRVLIVPTLSPPHKSSAQLLEPKYRLEMCRLAVVDEPKIEVSDIEIERGGVSYTADTLLALTQRHKNARLYFLMGADMFLTIEHWRRFREILGLAVLCVGARHEGEIDRLRVHAERLKKLYNAECRVERIPVLDISSTQIRNILSRGGDVSILIPSAVCDYIKNKYLYKGVCG